MSGQNIGRLEAGQRRLTVDRMERLAAALGCELADLLGEPEPLASTEGAPDLADLLRAVTAHWKSLGTDYARKVFADDLYRRFPAIRELTTKMVDND